MKKKFVSTYFSHPIFWKLGDWSLQDISIGKQGKKYLNCTFWKLTTLSKVGALSLISSIVTVNKQTASSWGLPSSTALTITLTSFSRFGSSRLNICKTAHHIIGLYNGGPKHEEYSENFKMIKIFLLTKLISIKSILMNTAINSSFFSKQNPNMSCNLISVMKG